MSDRQDRKNKKIIYLIYSFTQKINLKVKKILKFYIKALKDIDKEYNLVLENIVFSPKYNQQIPIIRLIGSGGYIIETAANILKHQQYKRHLHPDDLLAIHKLAQKNTANLKLVQEDLSGEIYLSNGESVNIYQPDLDSIDLDKLFSLPQVDVARLLESRGFAKGRKIALEIAELKSQSDHDKSNKNQAHKIRKFTIVK